ncbi:MAG: chemotaxis protein CheD [Pseudomonadota bacterium]
MTPEGLITGRVYIAQGEQALGRDDAAVIHTILGSCVAACLRDPVLRIGGMNHILLPDHAGSPIGMQSAGAGAMERLINALMKAGADRQRLEAKLFGGAAIVRGLTDVGQRNTAFALSYLENEGIPCVAQSIGGRSARQIKFWPASGRVRQRLVQDSDLKESVPTVADAPPGSDLELL